MISFREIEGFVLVSHEATPPFERHGYHLGTQLIRKSLQLLGF